MQAKFHGMVATMIENAHLYTTPGCPNCSTVKSALQQLQQQQYIGELTITDLAQQPELATELQIRSVPWLQLGPFILIGQQTVAELQQLCSDPTDSATIQHYFRSQLLQGSLATAELTITQQPQLLQHILPLLWQSDLPMQLRLGIMALFEQFERTTHLQPLLPAMAQQLQHSDHRIRADLCQLLELTATCDAVVLLQQLRDDPHAEVRESAADALSELQDICV